MAIQATEMQQNFYYYGEKVNSPLELVYAIPRGALVTISSIFGRGSFENIPLEKALNSLTPVSESTVRRELNLMERELERFQSLAEVIYASRQPSCTKVEGRRRHAEEPVPGNYDIDIGED